MDPEKLAVVIRGHGMSLGTTPNGIAWCMKALHPAANTEPITGIPDRSGIPISMIEFKSNFTIAAPIPNALWNAMIYLMPTPIVPATVQLFNSANAPVPPGAGGWIECLNQQLTGATYDLKAANWRALVGTGRLAYFSATVNFDCADLTNNGIVTAGQMTPGWSQQLIDVIPCPVMGFVGGLSSPGINNSNLINLPLAVQYRAKEGCYMPIKLTNPALPFLNQAMNYWYTNWWPAGGGPPVSTIVPGFFGYLLPQMLDGQFGAISFLNIAPTTSLRMTVRMGIEACPVPGSNYSSFMHPSPPVDHAALDAYYMISAKLFDAYPDEYNDWGALWNVIKGIAQPVGRVLKAFVPGGDALYSAGQAVGSAIDQAVRTKAKTAPTTGGSLIDLPLSPKGRPGRKKGVKSKKKKKKKKAKSFVTLQAGAPVTTTRPGARYVLVPSTTGSVAQRVT